MTGFPAAVLLAGASVMSCQPVLGADADPGADGLADKNHRQAIAEIAAAIEARYPIEAKGDAIASDLRQAAEHGVLAQRLEETAFIEAVNETLWDSGQDLHLRLYSDEALARRQAERGSRLPRMRRTRTPGTGTGSGSVASMAAGSPGVRALGTTEITGESLSDDTALVTITGGIYNNPELFADTLSPLSNAENIIVDLRQAPGGTRSGVRYFLSQFYDQPTHLSSSISREFDEAQEVWTLETALSETFAAKNLYVLTSERTASGAEAVAFAFKNTNRATLIGEKTAGAGNAGAFLRVGEGLSLFLPISQTVSPDTGEPWEGSGVEPHIQASEDDALGMALMAIEKGTRPDTHEDAS